MVLLKMLCLLFIKIVVVLNYLFWFFIVLKVSLVMLLKFFFAEEVFIKFFILGYIFLLL